jgi:hypothetical protein
MRSSRRLPLYCFAINQIVQRCNEQETARTTQCAEPLIHHRHSATGSHPTKHDDSPPAAGAWPSPEPLLALQIRTNSPHIRTKTYAILFLTVLGGRLVLSHCCESEVALTAQHHSAHPIMVWPGNQRHHKRHLPKSAACCHRGGRTTCDRLVDG